MPLKLVDYKELYESIHLHELEHRERIQARMQVSLGLAVALASGLAYLFQGADLHAGSFTFFAFAALFLVSSVALALASYHLVRVFWKFNYREIPVAQIVREYEGESHAYLHSSPPPPELVALGGGVTADQAFKNDFDDFLIEKFVNSATHNAGVNERRANHLYSANREILITAGAALVAFIIFTLGDLKDHKPQRVQVAGTTDVSISSAAGGCCNRNLTCDALRAQICNDAPGTVVPGCPPNERQKPQSSAPTSAAPGSAEAPGRALDQGGQTASSPSVTAPKKIGKHHGNKGTRVAESGAKANSSAPRGGCSAPVSSAPAT